jgi:ribosomal-protein-alanine N-acetyltransferase
MNETDVHIRPMAAADLDRVMAIADSLRDAPHWPRAAYIKALDHTSTPQRIALVTIGPTQAAVAGFAIARVLPPHAELETIAVASEGQRRGVGRQLFGVLADELKHAGVHQLEIEVRASNVTALAFYYSLGFVETGRRPRYYVDPVEDAALMGLQLS